MNPNDTQDTSAMLASTTTPRAGEIFRAADARLPHHEEIVVAKKAPNPIDKHVGSRVRMRRMMLGMSQEKLGDALGLTFQQVQKYEKGTNRIGASRLQQISQALQVPVAFFFEGAPVAVDHSNGTGMDEAPAPTYVSDFLATSDGLALTKAFMQIKDIKLRRRIVDLVEGIVAEPEI
jgi:transcriptional regulator with XRE-family HTH domain